jgi:transposase
MAQKYRVTLSGAERDELTALLQKGKAAARKLAHARVLLPVDESASGSGTTGEQCARALNLSTRTVERPRERFVERGLPAALLPRPSARRYERAFDGAQEARLLAMACSAPPEGKSRWTLRLLAEPAVEWKIVDTVSHESVRPVLKKNELRPHLRKRWRLPPKQSAQFVYHREEVLAVYHRPYQAQRPVVCRDESFRQLVAERREPLPTRPGAVERYESVYVRNGGGQCVPRL